MKEFRHMYHETVIVNTQICLSRRLAKPHYQVGLGVVVYLFLHPATRAGTVPIWRVFDLPCSVLFAGSVEGKDIGIMSSRANANTLGMYRNGG